MTFLSLLLLLSYLYFYDVKDYLIEILYGNEKKTDQEMKTENQK